MPLKGDLPAFPYSLFCLKHTEDLRKLHADRGLTAQWFMSTLCALLSEKFIMFLMWGLWNNYPCQCYITLHWSIDSLICWNLFLFGSCWKNCCMHHCFSFHQSQPCCGMWSRLYFTQLCNYFYFNMQVYDSIHSTHIWRNWSLSGFFHIRRYSWSCLIELRSSYTDRHHANLSFMCNTWS